MNNSKKTNPHAKSDGTPKLNELIEFVRWEKQESKKIYNALSDTEKEDLDKSAHHFSEKQKAN